MNILKKKLRSRIRKRIPRNLRERLIKKITLLDIETHDSYFLIHLSLKNLTKYRLRSKLKVILSSTEGTQGLDYHLIGKRISIEVPYSLIDETENRLSIELVHGQKQMIVAPDGHEETMKRSFFFNQRYFNVSTHGSLTIDNLLAEYRFNMNDVVEVKEINTAYEELEVIFNEPVTDNDYNLAFLYQSKIRIIENQSNVPGQFQSSHFSELTMGNPVLYLINDHNLKPLSYPGMPASMKTLNHDITYLDEDGYLTAELSSHEEDLTLFESTIEDTHIRMRFGFNSPVRLDRLLILDTTTDQVTDVPFSSSHDQKITELLVPLSAFVGTISRKRFMFETGGAEPLRLQPNISNLETFGFDERTWAEYRHEKFRISFYRRRDGIIGFKAFQRPLRRMVNDIDDFSLEGYIKGQDAFIDADPHIVFIDRYSLDYIRVPIDQSFKVDLKTIDFLDIKSKGKTVIDVFIEIVHSSGEVLRKEKIKFRGALYKKDNHYGRYEVTDAEGNRHYHLITTTPFDNLKVESFVVPKEINIPAVPKIKDMNVWLLGERYDTAQDNGYAMFRWLKANTDVKAYYVIEDSSEDYQKIKDEDNVLRFGSDAHFEVSFNAGVLLGTHDLENLLPYKAAQGFFGYEDAIKVFLQHGVLGRKPVEYHKKYYDEPFDIFIVSSEAEKRDVVMRKMGYEESEVAITGLARFDLLPEENHSKDILLMPTWRDWINTDAAFLESQYYARYHNLIHNPRLNRLLEENDVHLNFYPHYRAQSYFNDDYLDLGRHIHFIRLGQKKVQDLLIEHALLITDYSTVSFDFTLMNKPVVYYHFDARRFFRHGRLRPLSETFLGDIAKSEEQIVDAIEEYIHNGFRSKDMDLSGIFAYQDRNNRRRTYEVVMEKINRAQD